MPSILRTLKSAWDRHLRGRHQPPPDFDYPPPDNHLMTFIAEMFTAHGATAHRSGSWIIVDQGRLFVRADHFIISRRPDSVTLQTDFIHLTSTGRHIIESFASSGTSEKNALLETCQNYQYASFHALFTTLLDRPCTHVDKETWHIGGLPRTITFGSLLTRGTFPPANGPEVTEAIQHQIQANQLADGLHWVRYYHARIPGQEPVTEILVDNEPHPGLLATSADLPWPASSGFYSYRLFFTIRNTPS